MSRAYPTILEKAATLVEHLARNHPLPDGNKRAAFFLTGLFLQANGSPLRGAQPDIDVPMVEGIAAGQVEREDILALLSERTARANCYVQISISYSSGGGLRTRPPSLPLLSPRFSGLLWGVWRGPHWPRRSTSRRLLVA